MWSDKFLKNQYDEEALIGWNGSSIIDQSVKQVQTQPLYWSKCELKCHLAPTIKAWGMGKDAKKKSKNQYDEETLIGWKIKLINFI